MIKKSYNISGFDCANCARKTEEHLANNTLIESAHIDFAANRLYLSFKNQELSIEEILNIIKEVESDNITITNNDVKIVHRKIFTKSLFILLARVIFGLIVVTLAFTAFKNDSYFWVNFATYLVAVVVLTYDIIWKVIKHIIHKENPIDEYLLITISAYGAFIIASINKEAHDFMESVMVVALFQLGRIIEGIATNKSKEAIMAAVDLRIEHASVLADGELKRVKPEELKINDVVVVVAGEQIPIDGEVIEGTANVDLSSLTGEFVPIEVNKGGQVFSGTLIKTGSIHILVQKEYKDSTVQKIADLITNSGEKKSKADKFITKFARIYTPCVLIASFLFFLIGSLITNNWSLYGLSGLKMLVVACPCAIVISVPMAYFSALGLASKNGIVIKGSNYLEEAIRLKKVICDKTGTLTHGSFTIQKVVTNGVSEKELLNSLYIAEALSSHPIARAICHGQNLKKIAANIKEFQEISGLGTKAKYHKNHIMAGSLKFFNDEGIYVEPVVEQGTIIYCAVDSKYIGYVVLSDELKKDAQPMVDLLHSEGIELVLLTGDKKENAANICNELGLDRYQAELLPEQKTEALIAEMPENRKYSVGYIGDGINDAASIKRSDVGFAMGGIGSDVAVDSADIVIMNDDPAKVWDTIKISKMARNTALFNIITALLIKISLEVVIMIMGDKVPMFVAVLADTGLTVLLVINSLVLLYRKVRRKSI